MVSIALSILSYYDSTLVEYFIIGTGFNGGQINTSVTEVDSLPPPPLSLPCVYYTGDQNQRPVALM